MGRGEVGGLAGRGVGGLRSLTMRLRGSQVAEQGGPQNSEITGDLYRTCALQAGSKLISRVFNTPMVDSFRKLYRECLHAAESPGTASLPLRQPTPIDSRRRARSSRPSCAGTPPPQVPKRLKEYGWLPMSASKAPFESVDVAAKYVFIHAIEVHGRTSRIVSRSDRNENDHALPETRK